MSTQETILQLSIRLSEVSIEMMEAQTALDRLAKEHDALALALKSLESIQDDVLDQAIRDDAVGSLTYRQTVVFEQIPIGKSNALPPATIGKRCIGLEADYVRKTLQRMASYGRISAQEGRYWRTTGS